MKTLRIFLVIMLCLLGSVGFAQAAALDKPFSNVLASPQANILAQASQPAAAAVNTPDRSFQLDETSAQKVGVILLIFLVLSVIFEVAVTPIFNWSVFIKNFEDKGFKTPITVLLAFVVFWAYGLDILKDLLNAMGADVEKTLGGQALTALLIAGGSGSVYEIFTKLGLRNRAERVATVQQKESEAVMTMAVPTGAAKGTPQAIGALWDASVLARSARSTGAGSDRPHE